MDLRDAVSAVGLGVAALILTGLSLRTGFQSRRGTAGAEPGLLAASRASWAVGCAMLAASYSFTDLRIRVSLFIMTVIAIVAAVSLESLRRRRINDESASE
jgi:hypothetical protein